MEKLIAGLIEFQRSGFETNKHLFQALANKQEPDVLLITCSDSRIDPGLLTQSKPGDLFVVRNAGNIVPPHSTTTGGITASIEYAVSMLGVKHIIILGHTDCGAMKGAMHPENIHNMSHIANWLTHSAAALARVRARHGDAGPEQLVEFTQENVILQLKHLETHPSVAAKLAVGGIDLHGWVYDIPRGSMTCYDSKKKAFVTLEALYADYHDF